MKKIYLSFLSLILILSSTLGQSTWLSSQEGYISKDIISDKAFSCHDILGNNLYAIDSDGLYCYDLTTLEQTRDFGKAPAEYTGAWVSFVTADPDGTKLWLGYTVSGLTDDRIFSVDIATGTWTHVATFPGNFDMEIQNGNYYVSGLNTEGWDGVNDINCISLLDQSGNDNHKKLIEIGGNSTGLSVDASGNVYNAKYDPAGSTLMYQWAAADVANVIAATDGSFLTVGDGTVITSMPGNGPYDCATDDAGNMLFNCNDFTGGSFLAVWNGNTGDSQNYEKLGVYGGASFAWFAMLKATGDITDGGKAYMINYGDPIAEIRLSKAPSVSQSINDKLLPINAPQTALNLNDYFTAKEGETVEYSVSASTNSILANAIVDGTSLKIDYLADAAGTAEVTVKGTSSGDAANTTFSIELRDINYSNGAFIVNEDWFGHSNSTVNYVTSDKQFVYRAYQQENPGKTLGITTQFGTIYGGKFYFMSKQGPRLVVTDASTMNELVTIDEFNPGESGNKSDGRAFVGVTPQKGYIGTTRGIYIYDIDNHTVGSKIETTDGEYGNMLRAGAYVFAIKSDAVSVINVSTDDIEQTISGASYSGVVQAYDGFVYIGAGTTLLKVNPYTLEQQEIALPAGIEIPSAFGWAWNANSFCASSTENALFWAKPGGWSGSNIIYKYTIGDASSLDAPFITLEADMELYGAGLRVHPGTNQVYVTGKQSGWGDNSLTNTLYIYDGTTGNELSSLALEPYYWFPAMPVFPDAQAPVLDIADVNFLPDDAAKSYIITDLVSDSDNNDASILINIINNTDNSIAEAAINGNQLILTPGSKSGSTQITIQAISNGVSSEASFNVTASTATAIDDKTSTEALQIYPLPFNDFLTIEGADAKSQYQIYSLTGQLVQQGLLTGNVDPIDVSNLKTGTYIISVISNNKVSTHKVIKR